MSPPLRDDRGRPFRLHGGWLRSGGRSASQSAVKAVSLVAFAIVCVVGAASITDVLVSRMGTLRTPFQAVPFAIMGISAIVTCLNIRLSRPELVAARRAANRCAACGYSLAGAVAEEDRCCVCPECGAAWKGLPGPADRDSE